ncbi:GDSL-type esterase/lipase family protein, partial [Dermatophilus congolensis]
IITTLCIGLTSGCIIGRATAPHTQPTPTAEPLSGSGPIGPWQHYGHKNDPIPTMKKVADNPRGVLLLGDSVAARLHPALASTLEEHQHPMTFDHWNGRPTHAAADALVAIDAANAQPRTLVIVSGENDIFEPALFPVQIERIMRTAGPERHIYWVTPLVRRAANPTADENASTRLHSMLTEAATRHPNLHLVPWADKIRAANDATRTSLVPDGVHPSPEGVKVMASMILDTITSTNH